MDGDSDVDKSLSTPVKAAARSLLLAPLGSDGGGGAKRTANGVPPWRRYRILTPEELLAAGELASWHELEIRGCVKNLSPNLFAMTHLTALYLRDNDLYCLPPAIAKLTNLRTLDASNNRLLTVPPELGDLSLLEQLFLNNNLIRVLPYELGKLCKLKQLGLGGNPLTQEIRDILRLPGSTVRLLQHFMCLLCGETTSPPPEREWISTTTSSSDDDDNDEDDDDENDQGDKADRFTVMCYNVLCDKYATSALYSYCPPWALSWSYRQKGIMQELHTHASDVVSLQEVETEQFEQLFLPELEREGYRGVFSPKSRAKTMAEDERKHVDGCALFWRASRFELVEHQLIEFTQLAIANADGCQHMLNRVMTRDNIALVAVLRPLAATAADTSSPPPPLSNDAADPLPVADDAPLVVCTAHIHWDPEFCDVKLVQTMMMVQELDRLVRRIADQFNVAAGDVPLIVCGDFNSLPDSGVYEFLSTGKIAANHGDLKEFRNQSCLQRISQCAKKKATKVYAHQLKLQSAYEGHQLPFTDYTGDFKGVIDYIFATPKRLTRTAVLGAIDSDWFVRNKIAGCPHPNVPSDHIPLVVEYRLAAASSLSLDKAAASANTSASADDIQPD